jgi:hypothetical protein
MPTDDPSVPSQIPESEQRLLAGVEPRILRFTLILAILGTAGFWLWRGTPWAAGFAIGAALSALSFHWMKTAVHVLAESVTTASSRTGPRGTSGAVLRFLLRYALIGLMGYVIFRSSAISLAAFFAGLFVAIAATLAEIGYQIYLSFRRT